MVDAWEKSELLFLRFGVVGWSEAKGRWKDIAILTTASPYLDRLKSDQGIIDKCR